MIIKRIAQGIRNQDWFVVGVEVMVVVVGIFVGLQVTEWNEERKEVGRSGQIHDRLYNDLMEDASNLEERLVYWNKSAEYVEFAISFLETGQLEGHSYWEALLAIYQASNTWRFSVNRITYAELVSNGDLSLIRNDALRADLAEYYNLFDRRRSGLVYDLVPRYRFIIRGALHYQLQRNIHKDCHTEEVYVQAMLDCPAQMTEEEAAAHIKALADRPEILETLRYWMSSLRIGIGHAHSDRGLATRLATKVKEARP